MIDVVHVITGLDVGGAELALYRLLAAADPRQMRGSVVSLTDVGPVGARIRELGVDVHALRMREPSQLALAPPRLVRLLRRLRPDVVQTWMYHADLLGGLAGRAAGIRNVVWGLRMSDIAPGTERWTTRAVVRSSAMVSRSLPRRIVCCSGPVRDVHQDLGYADDRMVVIPNGFELPPAQDRADTLRDELGVPADAPVIGRVGRYHPMKDHATFARAAAVVQSRHRGAAFVLCGKDVVATNPELVAMFEAAGVGNVHLLGRRDDMDRVYRTLDVLCSSSSSGEGFPNVIGEAMAHGVPVVTTDVGDSANIVGDTGAVVRARDPDALGVAISEILAEGSAALEAVGTRARQRITEKFSMQRMVDDYVGLYRTLMP